MAIVLGYLAVGILLVSWGSWTYQQGVKNIFADFSLPSALAVVGLLAVAVILFWPLIFISRAQVQRQESSLSTAKIPVQGHYQAKGASSMSPP